MEKAKSLPPGNNELPPLDEFVVYETKYEASYVNYEGRTIRYKLITPSRRRIA